jgi:hypothetical protein
MSITTETYSFLHDGESAAPKPAEAEAPKPSTGPSTAPERARPGGIVHSLKTLIAAIRPTEPTPEPAIPQDPAATEPQTQPLSDFAIAARRLIARAEALTPVAAAPRTGRSNWPIEIIQLEVHVQRLLLETQVVGDVEAKAEAAAAKTALTALQATWEAARSIPVPVVAVVAERPAPAVDRGEHTVGRPSVGSLVHRFDESAANPRQACFPSVVVEIYGGAPSAGVEVLPDGPYLRLQDLSGGRPFNARHISSPTFNASPGFRKPISSWHRANSCPQRDHVSR